MDDFGFVNSSKRISEPLKVVWFEFLLNPSLLETHLQKENPDPSATELIIQFLANTNQGTPATTETSNNGALPEVNEAGDAGPERQKNLALKLLALKAAAMLNWNLNIFEQKLPITMQELILLELQKTTPPHTEAIGTTSPDALFAQILYHRWCLRIVNLDRYPVRGPKGLNILLPCQSDLSIVPAEQLEAIKKKIQEQLPESTKFLDQVLKVNCSFRMPRMACFGVITEQVAQPCHNWDLGMKLTSNEVKCQVAFDLGSYFFFQQNYGQSYECFQKAYELFTKIKKSSYRIFDESQFKGFLKASTYIFLGKPPTSSNFHSQSLEERLQMAHLSDHKETIQILLEDNLKREIPISLRSFVELEIFRHRDKMNEMYHQAATLNAVRKVIAGQVVVPRILHYKKVEKLTLLLPDALNAVIPGLSQIQKKFLKNFTRQICGQHETIRNNLVSSGVVESLFTEEEALKLSKSLIQTPRAPIENLFSNFTDDNKLNASTLERKLLGSSDPKEIIDLAQQLKGVSRHLLTSKWDMSNNMVQMVRNVVTAKEAEVIYFIMSKAGDLLAAKKYKEARALYQYIQVPCNRLNWILSTKILETELQECLSYPVYKPALDTTDILLKLHNHYSQQDRDLTIIELGCALCLNLRKWTFLNELDDRGEPFFRLSKVFSSVCNDMYSCTWRRSLYKELWDAMLPFFSVSNSSGYKRSSSGVIKDQRDMHRPLMPKHVFSKFITKLQDTMIIGILISCLSKFYNILKDETSQDIYLEYQNMWPVVITNASSYDAQLVMDMLHAIVIHGLSIHATHSSWLRALGDLSFVQKQYSVAMKHYLSSAIIISDYFSMPLPRQVMDDSFYLRMMTCCSLLSNHTQAAILGQFLEDPNYTTIFKSLSEKVCLDSCDMYYPFIWDLTVMEFLINLHNRRGEHNRCSQVKKLIGLLELNGNNNEEIQRESSNLRKSQFLRVIAKQYII